AFLGVELTLDDEPGLSVVAVRPRGAAAAADVRVGDRLLALAGRAVDDHASLRAAVGALAPARAVEFTIRRGDADVLLTGPLLPTPLEVVPGARVTLDHVVADGRRLRTLYTQPLRGGPCPAVLLLPGLACESCERPFEPSHPAVRLLAGFTAAGVATLRVERRGLGDSDGPPCHESDLDAEVAGFRAGLRQLRSRPLVDPDNILLFGHSLGGMIAPLVAHGLGARRVVVYGASAARWSACVLGSALRHADLRPEGPAAAQLAALLTALLDDEASPAALLTARPALRRAATAVGVTRDGRMRGRALALFRQLERVDLAAAWRRLGAEVRALHGDRDLVTTEGDAAEIARLTGGEHRELPGLDHGWRSSDGSDPIAALVAATLAPRTSRA
ncbi:MAG: alpha/beta fold hydrolase, partial [Myxococcales bacterium]|nr:alpha/beta fold hydrolase [Myxococcales bacterium]